MCATKRKADFEDIILECQSGTTADNNIFKVGTETTYENVQFADQHDPYMYEIESSMDSTRAMQDTNDASLENFFSRPIKVSEEEWSTGVALNYTIDPWSLYFNNPRVANRLANFNLMKCNLKVKVVINGNGFQYGRMLVNYLPFFDLDFMSTSAPLVPQDLVQQSQRPHIFLNPTTSTGGEMKLPMFNYQNYISITDAQWGEMGTLFFRTLNNLKHANGASDVVTITTFVWAEDVSMSVLTSVEPTTLTPQSGEIEEANTKGMISGPATSVAKFAAYLKGVPYIGPFALATEVGASAVSAMAKIFGYCRPPITKAPEPYRPTQVSSLALTNVPDNAQKLTVDDKQELTVDPRIAGIGPSDPLNIREIAKRESYLTSFDWDINTAPDTLLWNARVDPTTHAVEATTPSYHFPACCMAALPFKYWKGSMKFRFQVVCSSFHKGRLKIVYDPNFIVDSNYLTYSEFNTNYLRIVDISEEQDFTIEIGNGQDRSFLTHQYPAADPQLNYYSPNRYTAKNAGNGVIGVFVVNELTTPNSTTNNDIQINVFVSMGDDFEVAVPDDYFQLFVFKPPDGEEEMLEAQSGEIVPESQNTTELDAPQQAISSIVGLPPAEDSQLNKVFMGEAITSFRPLLKRYSLWNIIPKLDTVPIVISGRFPNFPYYRGRVTGAVDATATAVAYNYCNTLLLHYIRSAFSGSRGSIRYKIVPRGIQSRGDRIEVQRSAVEIGAPMYHFNLASMNSYGTVKSARVDIMTQFELATFSSLPFDERPLPGQRGMALTTNAVNGAIEFEVPYYSQYRFTPGKPIDYTSDNSTGKWESAWDYRAFFDSDNADSSTSVYDVYVSAGEDFQTYFFTGLPRMYFEPIAPA